MYKINGKPYHIQCRYDGEMFEATICDDTGTHLPFWGYGYKPCEAKRELVNRLLENDIRPGEDTPFVDWNTLRESEKKRILLLGRKIKADICCDFLLSSWESYRLWERRMHEIVKDIYPNKLSYNFFDQIPGF